MRSTTSQANQVGRDVQNVVTEAQELLKTVKEEGASQIDAKSAGTLGFMSAFLASLL